MDLFDLLSVNWASLVASPLDFLKTPVGAGVVFALMYIPAFAFDFLFKRGHKIELPEASKWSIFYILYGCLYGVFLLWSQGQILGTEYFTAFFTEKALSVDNLFVFIPVFAMFQIAGRDQQTVLGYGILGAIVFRIIFLTIGASLLAMWGWLMYPLALALVGLSIKAFKGLESGPRGVKYAKALNLSPMLACIFVIEFTDIIFAVDSIPAVLAITSNPLVAITSNVAAIQSLRSIFFVLDALKDKMTYLGKGIGVVLGLIGLKMLVTRFLLDVMGIHFHIDTLIWLATILGVLGTSILMSLRNKE